MCLHPQSRIPTATAGMALQVKVWGDRDLDSEELELEELELELV